MVVEAKNAEALGSKKRVAPCVALQIFSFEMLSTIEFHDKACRMANKVRYVRTNRCLPAKACAIHPVRAQRIPNEPFGIS